MKLLKALASTTLLAVFLASPMGFAAEKQDKKSDKTKPYPLEKCVVSDEKLGEHGKPYVFTEGNQEVKLCCKDCLKDFKKDKAKYMKKIESAEKKDAK
jgi:hypothetical protein